MTIKNKSRQASSNDVEPTKAPNLNFHGSMKSLLVGHDDSMEDKIATVRTARLVDNVRFEAAFKTLMKK